MPRQQSPKGLFAVSNEASFSGGLENLYRLTELSRTTTMWERDRRTRCTGARNSRDRLAVCASSFQMMTLVPAHSSAPTTTQPLALRGPGSFNLVLRELGLLPAADEGDVLGGAQHLGAADARAELLVGHVNALHAELQVRGSGKAHSEMRTSGGFGMACFCREY